MKKKAKDFSLNELTPEQMEQFMFNKYEKGNYGTHTAKMPDKNYPPDWTVPTNDTIDVPDELMPLMNQVGMQMRLHTISGKNEVLTCAHIVYRAQQFFLKDTLAFAEWLNIDGIRSGEHEWTYSGDNWKARYSTEQMYQFYKESINLKP